MDEETTFDPALVGRLSRPATRPGVVDIGRARGMLDRHRAMTPELPLTELMSRHTAAMAEPDGAAMPVVHARQAPPAGSSPVTGRVHPGPATSHDTGHDTGHGTGTSSPPVVPARPASPVAPVSAGPTPAGTAAPARRVVTPKPLAAPVIQRRVATAEPTTRPPTTSSFTTHPRPTPPSPGSSSPGLSIPGTPVPVQQAATAAPHLLPVPQPRVSARAASPRPTQAAPAGAPLPLTEPAPLRQVPQPEHSATAPAATGRPGAEWPQAVVSARQPHPAPRHPLLLADPAAVRDAREHPATSRFPAQSPAGHAPRAATDPTRTAHTARPAGGIGTGWQARREATLPEQPGAETPVDIGRIVDLVHNRFVRRLAVEAERRGIR